MQMIIESNPLESELAWQAHENQALLLFIDRRTQFLDTLRKQLRSVQANCEHHETNLKLRRISTNVLMELNKDLQWDIVRNRIQALRDGFLQRLGENHPGLTSGERQFCTLLRLSLSNQEVASLLGISMAAIEKKRYRIRKKLGLSRKDSLEGYLMAL